MEIVQVGRVAVNLRVRSEQRADRPVTRPHSEFVGTNVVAEHVAVGPHFAEDVPANVGAEQASRTLEVAGLRDVARSPIPRVLREVAFQLAGREVSEIPASGQAARPTP